MYHFRLIWRWIIRDLEIWVRGHSRSLKLVPFESSGAISYSPSIVTMALSCIVCAISRLIGRKSQNFYTPPVFSAPAGGDPVVISQRRLLLIKLEWLSYRVVQKNYMYNNILSCFHRIPERNGRTDIRTDGQICYINIARQHTDAR